MYNETSCTSNGGRKNHVLDKNTTITITIIFAVMCKQKYAVRSPVANTTIFALISHQGLELLYVHTVVAITETCCNFTNSKHGNICINFS